ncbi:hypothetical protein LEN26_015543 [Aphanomyces euteiches]|nr:hypothetical protein LEN26_015543 [Aphanomyces euteiches]
MMNDMVEEIRRPTTTASFTRWSFAYNIIFILNLVTTPFTAYLTEPRPVEVNLNKLPTWNSFDEYVVVMTGYLSGLYNNKTMDASVVSRRDPGTNTFAFRHDMTIPFQVDDNDAFSTLLKMPSALFYGLGIQSYASNFMKANETIRNQMRPWQMCQHERLLGMTWIEICIWMDEIGQNRYTVWAVTLIYEAQTTIWLKCAYRCVLSSYVLWMLWKRYYRHYAVLLSNLRLYGIESKYIRYEIVVGDPVYAILSDPVIAFGLILDFWWNLDYVSLGLMRVAQFQDFWMYVTGCIYLSRYVWCSYFGVQIMSYVVKRRRWELKFTPLDPALLAIGAFVYCGPVVSILATTKLVWIFYLAWGFFLPSSMRLQATESITGDNIQ